MGKKISYILDIENLTKFIFDSDVKRDMDSEITEVYVVDEETNEMVLTSKQFREFKGGDNTSKSTIRYDMVKMFIDMISDIDMDGANSFGESLIFNTMINEGLIKEVE